MIQLKWAKAPNGEYYTLQGWDFTGIKAVGVYHIWCVGKDGTYGVRSGQGLVGARITAHKSDPKITRHSANGTLGVTWATVPAADLDGVERYLADQFGPVEGDRYPDVVPIPVNLPGA